MWENVCSRASACCMPALPISQHHCSELLEGFIKKYVQCYSCNNPETTIRVKKDFITLKCKACGAVRTAACLSGLPQACKQGLLHAQVHPLPRKVVPACMACQKGGLAPYPY